MGRKCASIAFGLALIVALGLVTVRAQALPKPVGTAGFSSPCEPAPPAFQAASDPQPVSTIDPAPATEDAGASTAAVRAFRVEAVPRLIPPQASAAYAPLWHRPPPANS
jgi:hypothetical protein